jgi:hypothetical protein
MAKVAEGTANSVHTTDHVEYQIECEATIFTGIV